MKLQTTPESGSRASYDGHKHKRGSKTHMAVDTLGHLPAVLLTLATFAEGRERLETCVAEKQEKAPQDQVAASK